VPGIDNGDGGPVLGEAQQFPGAPRQLSRGNCQLVFAGHRSCPSRGSHGVHHLHYALNKQYVQNG
jgi:hypothetical protein